MSADKLFTREEVLGGLPARQAQTLLFLIESRTAHLVAQSQQAMEPFLTEETAQERDLAFLEAFSLGRDPPLRPTIQDLERYAPQWKSLVPSNPNIRAAVAHLLGQKYEFTSPVVPGIRATLGLDDEAVQRAYRRLYREPLETIFTGRSTVMERLRWVWAALAAWPVLLSPFWIAFVVTIALSLPQAILALPIAVAYTRPLNGILLLTVIGFINVLTMMCMAETIARNGAMRYGKAFVGRLVTDYLGNTGSFLLTLTLAIRTFLVLLASSIGMGITLAIFTGIPAAVWIILLFCIELYLLSGKSLNITLTVMIVLAAINITLLLTIVLLAFMYMRVENLLYSNGGFFGGEAFDPSMLRLVFGVLLMLYFGHVYTIQCAKLVLPRDPSGRSLIWGSVAGTFCLTVFFCIWVLAIGGAIPSPKLSHQTGTVLPPLVEHLGPSIHMLGSALVIFLLGMACIRSSNVLFNLVYERLPTRLRSTVRLSRRRGSLLLHQRGASNNGPRLGLTYLGLAANSPTFA